MSEHPVATPDQMERYLESLREQTPALAPLVAAFGPLLMQQAAVLAGLPPLADPIPNTDAPPPAPGEPLASLEDLLACPGMELAQYMRDAGASILPALAQGFPTLSEETTALGQALESRALDAGACLAALLAGEQAEFDRLAQEAGISPPALGFILLALAKPLLTRRAQALALLLPAGENATGACPICGALPELAYLQGEGGQRWLRCSLCAHHWRFARTVCPVCGNQDQEQMEFLFAEGEEHQRVEACLSCGHYLVTLDLRGLDEKPPWPAAALGLVHLDFLAQERGLTPAAPCAWNQLD